MGSVPTVAGIPRSRVAQRATAAYFLVNGVGVGAWVPHLPDRARALHLDAGTLGWVLLSSGVGAVLAMPLTGRLIPRVGSRRICRLAGAIFPPMLPLLVMAPTPLLLALALLAMGISGGSMDVAMNAQGIAVEERLGERTLSRLHGLWSIGAFSGAAATSFLLVRHVPATLIALSIATLMLSTLLVASPWLLTYAEEGVQPHPRPFRPHRRLLLLGMVVFAAMVAEGSIADWSGLYLRLVRAAGQGVSGYGYAAFAALMVTGRLCGDRVVARLGEQRVLLLGALLAAAGLAVVVATGWAGFASPAWWLAGFALVGAGLANCSPVLYRTAGRVPGVPSGAGIATAVGIGYAGLLAGPPALGFVGQQAGLTAILVAVIAMCGLLALASPLVRGLTQPR
jgi:MFS family permease